ncbi:hypothetical protein ACJ6WD_39925 [Streptomyces sp. VTCC 41912]|uniref:hypothetical protein n=1 Tax=Streptomyces sp. VTCC 41912 TaxID=3383243 RepID=UPI003896E8D4
MSNRRYYEAEVTVRTSSGEEVTYRGDGVGPAESGDALLSGAEAAALAQEPGGTVTSSRVREA